MNAERMFLLWRIATTIEDSVHEGYRLKIEVFNNSTFRPEILIN